MRFADELLLDRPVGRIWPLLLDVPAVAPCFPGASLSTATGHDYVGTILVRVGPIAIEYAGTARITQFDEVSRTINISASGRAKRGAGLATAEVVITLSDDAGTTVMRVDTDLHVTGRLAQYGSGVIQQIATSQLREFAAGLAEMVRGD